MKSLPRTLLYCLGGGLAFAGFAVFLTQAVQYHPPGVKPHQREAYAEKMRQISEVRAIVARPDADKLPRVTVQQESFDFGMVDPHTTLSHSFVITNQGASPLQLSVAKTSCKCTVGELQDQFLLPGAKTNITLTWNTGYQAEHYQQSATVLTNDPLAESFHLTVEGTVRAVLSVPERISFAKADLGVPTEAKFVVSSQLWDDFTIQEVDCDLGEFQWHAEPISSSDPRLADAEARSAWEVHLYTTILDYGKFKDKVALTVRPGNGGDDVVRKLSCEGKVRAPINFYSNDIHPRSGLDIGTLTGGKEHQFHLITRARGADDRTIEVLDVEPDAIEASLQPLSTPGSYRLTVKVPADCPMVVFNGDHKHGYVQVGDPEDKDYSNWFPLLGAVVNVDR